MTIKNAVYGGLGFFLLIIVVLFIFKGQQKPEIEKTASDLFPTPVSKVQPVIPQILRAEPPPAPSFSSLFEESLLKPVFLEPVLEIKELIKPVKKEAVFSLLPPESPSLNSSLDEGLIAGANEIQQKKSSLSTVLTLEQEKEIFDKLYPDYFRNALFDIQNVFIEFGYLESAYQKIENFDTEGKIFLFINTGTDVFEKQGWYTKEEAEKFRRGTNEIWKNLMEKEKLELRQRLIKSDFYKYIFARRVYYFKRMMNQRILDFFGQLIKDKFLLKVYADSVGDSPGSCWESGPAKPGGANVHALCCDCGIKCGKKTCWYVHHCGPDGEQCDIQLGCLNKMAGIGDNPAIWDPETGICGVG